MNALKSTWIQALVIAGLGAGAGLLYRAARTAATAWSSSHYRLDESANFSMEDGFPFAQQFIIGASGERIEVPVEEGDCLDLRGATWWNVDATGRMRTWDEEREEVLPVLVRGS